MMVTEISNVAKNNLRRSLAFVFVVFLLAFSSAGVVDLSRSARAQSTSPAATPATQALDRIELHQALLDLTNPWTVMCIAAHPDDEDGTSLIVMRRKFGAHTVSLFSTFGEGGQNAIGPELYEELGAIRARETMAAAEIQGSEPYFLGLKDFGYSKSAEEAFRVWGHDEALRRMVLQVRKLRPDVIITNHSVTNNDHGHHQATARLELEAFDAAADPKRFPEQLKDGVTPWQVQRLFVRAGRSQPAATGQNPDRQVGLDSIVTIDPNELDSVRGKVYAEEALQALQQHATQGPWPKTVAQMAARFTNSSDGRLPLIRYRLTREAKSAEALSKDSHNFLDGMALTGEVAKQLSPPTIDGRLLTDFTGESEKLIDALIAGQKSMKAAANDETPSAARLNRLRHLIDKAIVTAAGLEISILPTAPVLVQNSSPSFLITISNRGTLSPWVIATNFDAGDLHNPDGKRSFEIVDLRPYQLEPGETKSWKQDYHVQTDAPITVPHAEHLYDGRLSSQMVSMLVSLKIKGAEVGLRAATWFDVAPPVEIASITPSPLVLTPPLGLERVGVKTFTARPAVFTVNLVNHQTSSFNGNLSMAGATADNRAENLAVKLAPGENKTFTMVVVPPAAGPVTFNLVNGKMSAPPLQVPIVAALAQVAPNLRVGYVRGFDYSLPNALAALYVESKELTVDEVQTGDLQKYSTIIVDNRVYESQPGLIAANQKLLDYAKDGGTLIVFYHKSFEWNPNEQRKRPQLAPYKLILGDERVTDETAPITLLEPEHSLLNVPNKIGQEDFANWIQERGLYYPKEWDPHYSALFETNDPGEAPLKGGLLVADYGRGRYIYTSMVWYRELRAGVPGAYRMFANMISYGHK
jgi:LmbE family N-acetylglucosaminyl deacetylase